MPPSSDVVAENNFLFIANFILKNKVGAVNRKHLMTKLNLWAPIICSVGNFQLSVKKCNFLLPRLLS